MIALPALPDSELYLLENVDLGRDYPELLAQLIASIPWEAREIKLWGKTYLQPRLMAWYGDVGCRHRYSGLTLEPLPWTPLLADLKSRIEKLADHRFNSVLANYYRNQADSMGLHSDDERELGPEPVIASLSLGEERSLQLKHRRRRDLPPVRLALPAGSVLIMRGQTQRHWKHGIPKQRAACGPRVNLTFRTLI